MKITFKELILMFVAVMVINMAVFVILAASKSDLLKVNSAAKQASLEIEKKLPVEQVLYISNEIYFYQKQVEHILQIITLMFSVLVAVCLANIRALQQRVKELEQQK